MPRAYSALARTGASSREPGAKTVVLHVKGWGVFALLAGIAYALTRVEDIGRLILGLSITFIVLSLLSYAASVRRRRRDERVAGG
ncbi:hypothetical protein AB0D11_24235 [Streptomyces monashensis]|uniref:hypothetical protein n=1 Tax=Streptomyces monashensis TaxID=1678012 RepID=UPI0033D3FF39